MTIEAITSQYQADKVPDIIKDYRQLQAKLGVTPSGGNNKTDTPWWSGDIVQEALDKDYLCAKSLTALAVLNGPTDVEDLVSAGQQIKSGFKNKKPDGYDPKIAQHPFSFFRGTVLHEYLNPNSEKCLNKSLAKKVIKADVSLRDTKLGEWILNKLGVQEVQKIPTTIESLQHTKDFPDYVLARSYNSKTIFGDLTARALTRTPKIGAYVLGGLGAIHAGYQIAEGNNIFKEVSKTALEVGTTLTAMGYLGAIGYKHLGTLGSLTGMAAGTALGAISPKLLGFSKSSSESL